MSFKTISVIVLTCTLVACTILSCGKDDKSTGPLPTGEVTLRVGSHQPTFTSTGVSVTSSPDALFLAFSQADGSIYPNASIILYGASLAQVGEPVDCTVSIFLETTTRFITGTLAHSDSALSNLIFNRLELQSGGYVSGTVTGLAERQNHPEEGLLELSIDFANVYVY